MREGESVALHTSGSVCRSCTPVEAVSVCRALLPSPWPFLPLWALCGGCGCILSAWVMICQSSPPPRLLSHHLPLLLCLWWVMVSALAVGCPGSHQDHACSLILYTHPGVYADCILTRCQ